MCIRDRHQYCSSTISVLFQYCSGAVPVLHPYYSNTTSVLFQDCSGTVPVLLQYCFRGVPILFLYSTSIAPVLFQCCPNTYPSFEYEGAAERLVAGTLSLDRRLMAQPAESPCQQKTLGTTTNILRFDPPDLKRIRASAHACVGLRFFAGWLPGPF